MKFITYILQSVKFGKYYIGHTHDMEDRLVRHNSGLVRSTKKYLPWVIVYFEIYNTKSEVYRRELEIKRFKGGILFKRLLGQCNKIMRKPKTAKYLLKM
jgi:putative endonuclease